MGNIHQDVDISLLDVVRRKQDVCLCPMNGSMLLPGQKHASLEVKGLTLRLEHIVQFTDFLFISFPSQPPQTDAKKPCNMHAICNPILVILIFTFSRSCWTVQLRPDMLHELCPSSHEQLCPSGTVHDRVPCLSVQ